MYKEAWKRARNGGGGQRAGRRGQGTVSAMAERAREAGRRREDESGALRAQASPRAGPRVKERIRRGRECAAPRAPDASGLRLRPPFAPSSLSLHAAHLSISQVSPGHHEGITRVSVTKCIFQTSTWDTAVPPEVYSVEFVSILEDEGLDMTRVCAGIGWV